MHAEDLLVHNSSHRQAVEAICEGFPQLNVVPSLRLIIEAINSVDGGTFVISTKNKEILRIFHFVGEKKADGLQ
jgi:hypothetical protein